MGAQYTAHQFVEAIPGTGGVISDIAEKVGCAWNTARKYIDRHPSVYDAWDCERNRITDIAENNIIQAVQKGDLQMSKWWLQVMRSDFIEKQRVEHSGPEEGPVRIYLPAIDEG